MLKRVKLLNYFPGSADSQGVYALVSSLGSLFVRIILQPFEVQRWVEWWKGFHEPGLLFDFGFIRQEAAFITFARKRTSAQTTTRVSYAQETRYFLSYTVFYSLPLTTSDPPWTYRNLLQSIFVATKGGNFARFDCGEQLNSLSIGISVCPNNKIRRAGFDWATIFSGCVENSLRETLGWGRRSIGYSRWVGNVFCAYGLIALDRIWVIQYDSIFVGGFAVMVSFLAVNGITEAFAHAVMVWAVLISQFC